MTETTDFEQEALAISERLSAAIQNSDKQYLEDFDRGRAAAEAGEDRNEPSNQGYTDGYDSAPPLAFEGEGEPQDEGDDDRPPTFDPDSDLEGGSEDDEEKTENPEQPEQIQIGFHPLGGIAVLAQDRMGNQAQVRLTSLDQVANLAAQLLSHHAMLTQLAYQQAAMERQAAEQLIQQPTMAVPGNRAQRRRARQR